MIRAGRLDQIIEIQVLTTTPDGMGDDVTTWTAVTGAPTRAEYIPLRGQEMIQAGTLQAKTPVKFRIRRWSTLEAGKHRIKHDNKFYKILAVEDYKRQGRDMLIWTEYIA